MRYLFPLLAGLLLLGCETEDLATASSQPDANWPVFAVAIGVAEVGSDGVLPPTPTPPSPDVRPGVCPSCNGAGQVGDGTTMRTCKACKGTGKVSTELPTEAELLERLEANGEKLEALELAAEELLAEDVWVWETDWNRAMTLAQATGKHVLVVFHNTQVPCKPCIKLEKEVLPKVAHLQDQFIGLKLDGATAWPGGNKTTAEVFSLRAYPWVLIADPKKDEPILVGAPPLDPEKFESFVKGEK